MAVRRRDDNNGVGVLANVSRAEVSSANINKKTSCVSTASSSSVGTSVLPPIRKNSLSASERHRDFVTRTLAEDYPGLDYLGFHNVLNAKNVWYRVLWFTIVTICLIIGLYTIYRIFLEYANNPSATLISVKSVDKLLLPQLTVCATHAGTINLPYVENALFHPHIANYSQTDVLHFAYFMLAGSGFQKMKLKNLDAITQERMAEFYDIFRGQRTIRQFFDYFMNTFGLQCQEFLQDCRLGDEKLDCCKVFEPEYLMRRGRCFRSLPLYQRSYDELGKLRVSLRQPFSMDPSMPSNEEVLAFLAEHKRQIAPFPRYYLYPNVCSEENSELSKDTCYVQHWLRTHLEQPHNCTYPYMHYVRNVSLPSCHPSIIVDSYEDTVEATSYTMHSCVLACERWEYTVALERTPASLISKNAKNLEFAYRIDVSYNDLQFEEIQEVSTVTLAGLIAQVGGQLSLFMGSSILNLTQFVIMILILTRRALRKRWRRRIADKPSTDIIHVSSNGVLPAQKFENAAFDVVFQPEHLRRVGEPTRHLITGPRAAKEFLGPRGESSTPSSAKSTSTSPTRQQFDESLSPRYNAPRRSRRRGAKYPLPLRPEDETHVVRTPYADRRSPSLSSSPLSSVERPPAPPPHYDVVNRPVPASLVYEKNNKSLHQVP